MNLDCTQIFVAPNVITFPEWVYTDLPTPQGEVHNVVVLTGNSTSSQSLGGTMDDQEN